MGTKLIDDASVVDKQGIVLDISKPPGIDAGVPSEDESVHPLASGTRHPPRRGAKIHRFAVEPPAICEGRRAEVVREFIPGTDHGTESRSVGKASSRFAAWRNRHSRTTGFHAPG